MGRTPLEQALIILGVAFHQSTSNALAQLTIAQRDTALFLLRERIFGSQLNGLADCPACKERLELAFDAEYVRSMKLLTAMADSSFPDADSSVTTLLIKDYKIDIRLPNSADLLKLRDLIDEGGAQRHLLKACIVSITDCDEQVLPDSELPDPIKQMVMEQIGQMAALANLTISTTCPGCGYQWEIIFDIVSYFWSEINAWATRMIRETHILASTYGWCESDILEMSALRRQHYLELIGG